MKLTATADALANALALAASLSDDKKVRKILALEAVHLKAADGVLTIISNVLDFALTLTVPASVEVPGEVALSGARLAALAAACPPKAEIEITADAGGARVFCGRSRFRLPTVPLDIMPPIPRLGETSGEVALAREEAVSLLVKPAFATSAEETRYYIGGVLLRDDADATTPSSSTAPR